MNTIPVLLFCFVVSTLNFNLRVILNSQYRGRTCQESAKRVLEWILWGWLCGRVLPGGLIVAYVHFFQKDLRTITLFEGLGLFFMIFVLNVLGTMIERGFDEKRYLRKCWYYDSSED